MDALKAEISLKRKTIQEKSTDRPSKYVRRGELNKSSKVRNLHIHTFQYQLTSSHSQHLQPHHPLPQHQPQSSTKSLQKALLQSPTQSSPNPPSTSPTMTPSVDYVPKASLSASSVNRTETADCGCAHWSSLRREATTSRPARTTSRRRWRTWRMWIEKQSR